MHEAPYRTELKPYGRALADLARCNPDIICLSGDLTRQCEVDLFAAEFPDRFIHGGMAEANMIGVAAALARKGLQPWVHTFGVFATRRPLDQIVNAVAYPNLPVRIVGFMPGVSSPGGPSHQAIDDVALMRALPNMTVVDVADAVETRQAVRAIADVNGPVYMRLKRGEIPVIFGDDHVFRLEEAAILPRAITATSEPGSDVAETIAEAGLGRPLRRVGLRDAFAEGALTSGYLFEKYGLSTQALIETIWSALGRQDPAPRAPVVRADAGEYSPV
jgi:transketolase